MTSEEHRRASNRLREIDPAAPLAETLAMLTLARHHDQLAELIERRISRVSEV